MRVVSKPSQAAKILKQQEEKSPETIAVSRKRTRTVTEPASPQAKLDDSLLLDALARLEKQQQEQQQMISRLIADGNKRDREQAQILRRFQGENLEDASAPDEYDFDRALETLMAVYSKIPAEERPQKYKKQLETLLE